MKASNSKSNKVQNRNIILKMIALKAPISRIALSELSGLSKMSLTNIISEFKDEGLVTEIGIDSTASGKRKPVLLELTTGALCSVGIHITRSYAEGCLADIKGNMLITKKEVFPETLTASMLTDIICHLIQTILSKATGKVVGIGISGMGPLDLTEGVILNPTQFYGIENVPILRTIYREFPGIPAFLCKNTNSAALAEKYYGTDRTIKNFVYMGVSKGVGCSAVINDHLLLGSNGFSCELGHISVNPDGETCSCGNKGCLELYANLYATEQYAEKQLPAYKNTVLKQSVTYEQIIAAAKQNDPLACHVLDRQCSYLSIGVINLINAYDPEVVIIGNEIAVGGDEILRRIKERVQNRFISCKHHPVDIVMSKFQDKAPLLGSAVCVFENLYFE